MDNARTLLRTLCLGLACAVALPAGGAMADSCWNHNGSIMRLKASGNQRWFYYEHPKAGLAVQPGTLLFNGVKSGNWYSGTARVFSKYCPEDPLEYFVEGPVGANQTKVTMTGTREVFDKCVGTGKTTTDTLVFTYKYDC